MKCISIFKCNPQIEVIDKSHCFLEDVPNFQNYSKSLEELYLDSNRLCVLNENVFRLTKLRRLSCSDNSIEVIPPDIARLVNLVELDCSKNEIKCIPEQIKFLRGLQYCDFSTNQIEYLPSGFVQLKNLTCLTIDRCGFQNLPDDIGLLKNLESLQLRENELESLPASISDLSNLKKLDIGDNLIKSLPDDIGRLTKLEYLILDRNELETVPTSIEHLRNLQCLDLDQQRVKQTELRTLKYLPEEISGLTSLTNLYLSSNDLQTLPDGIRKLKNLIILKADNNFLDELNPNIGGCIALQELVLTSNRISKLPSQVGNLTELQSVNIDSNYLVELTPQICNLKRLVILSLRDNLLKYLPKEIGQMESLKVIDFSGNRLEYLPTSITALNLKALWLSKNQAQPLPKLQIDELSSSGTKILTCYLLPQQIEDLNVDDSGAQQTFEQGDFEGYENNRQAAITFDTAAVDDAELSNDANFVRHDTPHPRELKARHQKLFTNASGKPELRGLDNASFSMADNQSKYSRDYEPQQDPAISYQQHVGYESNGLPEVLTPMLHDDTGASAKSISSRVNNYPDYHASIDRNGNNQDSKYSHDNDFEPNGRLNPQYRDATRNLRRVEHEADVRNYNHNQEQLRHEDSSQILDILVRRSKNHKPGLGLSIAGGKDTPPYKDDDEGIFVSKVTRGGPAEAAGVKEGDKILAVNNNIFYEGITHQKAVDIFKKVKPDFVEFTIRVLRDPNDTIERQDDEFSIQGDSVVTSTSRVVERNSNTSNFTRTYTIPVKTETSNGTAGGAVNNLRQFLLKEPEPKAKSTSATLPPGMSLLDNQVNKNIIYTTLVKDYKHDLGLVLENKNDDADPRSTWSNIVLAEIKPNSIASKDGKLQVNDRLVTINGADVTGIDLDRIMLMLEGTERFIRIVVSRGDDDDPIGAALRNMPVRPPLGSWFSSTSNMSHRPSLIESYQRPTFGSVSSLQKQHTPLIGTKPPKPPKPSHLVQRDDDTATPHLDDNPVARPRGPRNSAPSPSNNQLPQTIDAEKRAAWRRERLKSIEDDVEMAKLIAEAQRRRREEQ